ncbi:MAG: xylulokinase [Steroidobacteraceae bacterium]
MLFLGIDIGTTAVKAALFGPDGTVATSWRRDYPTRRAPGGIVEQNPQDWLDGIAAAVSAFDAEADLQTVRAIGICSHVNTHVFVGEHGSVLANAFVWQDTRAAEEAAELAATITSDEAARWWGSSVPLDASHALARMQWMRRNHPKLWEETRYVLSPKDFCLLKLTGAVVADPIASVGLVNPSLGYINELLARVPGALERLPPLRPFEFIAGSMALGSAGAAVPVVTGTMDAWTSLFGAGAYTPGKGLYMSGTSEILALVSARRIGAQGVITFPCVDSAVVSAGPTQSGGDSIRWWAQITGRRPMEVFAAAAGASRSDPPVLFLPHLEGERAPFWDSQLRGAFIGLSSQTGDAQLALAVLEGVALSARLVLHSLRSAAGLKPAYLLYGGGGSRSHLWSQIRADCLDLPLHRLAVADAGCLGAAILAAVGIGAFRSVTEAAAAMAKVESRFYPEPRHKNRYEHMNCAYLDATRALKSATRHLRDAG